MPYLTTCTRDYCHYSDYYSEALDIVNDVDENRTLLFGGPYPFTRCWIKPEF